MSNTLGCGEQAQRQYDALVGGFGFAPAHDRTRIDVTGKDAAPFLHRLTTNEIQKLAVGAGREVFFPNTHGKTIGHAFIFRGEEYFRIDAEPGQTATLLSQLDRYLIRDDVQLVDVSSTTACWIAAGAGVASALRELGIVEVPSSLGDWCEQSFGEQTMVVRRVEMLGVETFLLESSPAASDWWLERFRAAGAIACEPGVIEARRIECGFPLFGHDISPENLPQELVRDDRAISFTKGCYLGQETIARLDALGHVNRTLVALEFAANVTMAATDETLPIGAELFAGDKCVGKITSAARSPRTGGVVALAFVRRGFNQVATKLNSAWGETTVIPFRR